MKNDGKKDCCVYWHTAYHKWENAGERIKDCFVQKNLFDIYDEDKK